MDMIEGEGKMAAPERMDVDWAPKEDIALVRAMKEVANTIPFLSSWLATDASWREITRMLGADGFDREPDECKARFVLLCCMNKEELVREENHARDDTRANHEVVAELRGILPVLSAAPVWPAVPVRGSGGGGGGDDDDDRGGLSLNGDARRRNARHGASSVNDDARQRKIQRLARALGHKVADLAAEVRDLGGEVHDLGGEVREIERDARELETATAHLALTERRVADRRVRRVRSRTR